ncbi:MAG: hypothetical protein V1839_02590 [archaeon]
MAADISYIFSAIDYLIIFAGLIFAILTLTRAKKKLSEGDFSQIFISLIAGLILLATYKFIEEAAAHGAANDIPHIVIEMVLTFSVIAIAYASFRFYKFSKKVSFR